MLLGEIAEAQRGKIDLPEVIPYLWKERAETQTEVDLSAQPMFSPIHDLIPITDFMFCSSVHERISTGGKKKIRYDLSHKIAF